jgi:hypothetical protein
MPAVSKKQEKFMQAVANNPAFAKKVGVPQSVGREFTKKEGGTVKSGIKKVLPTSEQMGNMGMKGGGMKESKKMMAKEVSFMKKKGAPKSMIKHEMAEAGMKHGGATKKMSAGGYTRSADGVAKKGKTRGTMVKMMGGGKAC